jgi:hypothetical protein
LAGKQADEFLGIDLPDLVGPTGPGRVESGSAAFGGRAEPRLPEPALERARRGERRGGAAPAEEDTDEARTPGRVFSAEGEGTVVQWLGVVASWGVAVAVGRVEHGVGLVPPAAQQLADGAWGQAEGLGDGGGGLAAALAAQDGLAERQRSRCWHERSSRWGKKPGCGRQLSTWHPNGKTSCRI